MEKENEMFSMNVYDFMNSEAIARHCRQAGHSFTPLETAYLIDRSWRHSLAEKHQAFAWVIKNMPDEQVNLDLELSQADGKPKEKTVSLRWYLRKYMELQRKYPESLCYPDQKYGRPEDTEFSGEERRILDGFDQVCFVCPTPFQKGDIVWTPCYENKDPFVFREAWYENMSEDERNQYVRGRAIGSMDMTAYGYFQDEDGSIYRECMHDYLALEYYGGEFCGKKRILKALSSFLKDEIDEALLMNAYHIIMSEEYVHRIRKSMGITKEGLRLAGLLEQEEPD